MAYNFTIFLKQKRILFLFFVLFVSLFIASPVFAQIINPLEMLNNSLSFEVTPEFPEPNEKITITITSFSVDLKRSSISWFINGKTKEQGPGKTSIETVVGDVGSQLNISVSVNTQNQESLSKNITIRPGSVDLLWEAETYTPPFYKGKALPTSKSILKIVAVPELVGSNGRKYSASDLIYTWKNRHEVLGSLSGRGRETLEVEGARLFDDLNVSVEVESVDNALTARNSIFISAQSPQILFYEDHPTRGILFEKNISDIFNLTEEEVSFVAIPFFFSGEKRGSESFTYLWSVNNQEISPTGEDPSTLTLRPEEGSAGISTIGLSVRTSESLLQEARGRFSIQFNNTERSSGF